MKRVIKASVVNVDKLEHVDNTHYDQEVFISELASTLDTYGIDIQIDFLDDTHLTFTTSQPQYPKVGKHSYTFQFYHGTLESYTASIYRPGEYDATDLLCRELVARFEAYFKTSPEYISVVQSYIDEALGQLDDMYNTRSTATVKYLKMSLAPLRLFVYFDSNSYINIDGSYVNLKDTSCGDRDKIYKFLLNMTPSNLSAALDSDDVYAGLQAAVESDISEQFANSSDILSETVELLNSKFDSSKYNVDVIVAENDDNAIRCTFIYEGAIYYFNVYCNYNKAFSHWFKDSYRDYDAAIDYMVKDLYKRITAKCRRLAAKQDN